MPGLSLIDGKLYPVGADGRPSGPALEDPRGWLKAVRPQCILVHGYRWQVGEAHRSQYPGWREWAPSPALGLAWQSRISPWGAWRAGYVLRPASAPYRWAWDRAAEVGLVLRRLIKASPEPVSLIGHSLGTRVVLAALNTDAELPVDRVLLLNGAEKSSKAARVLRHRECECETLLVGYRRDRVLRYLARLFTPGELLTTTIGIEGLGDERPKNVREVWLGEPSWKDWGGLMDWELKPGGHRAFEEAGNLPLLRAFLAGEEMAWPEG